MHDPKLPEQKLNQERSKVPGLRSYFVCEGHPLRNLVMWSKLKTVQGTDLMQCIKIKGFCSRPSPFSALESWQASASFNTVSGGRSDTEM